MAAAKARVRVVDMIGESPAPCCTVTRCRRKHLSESDPRKQEWRRDHGLPPADPCVVEVGVA